MDLSNLKNIDLKDIVTKLKSGKIGDKKILVQFYCQATTNDEA